MARKTESPGLIGRIMKFFGISSPAMLILLILSYFGIKVPGTSTELKETQENIAKAKEVFRQAADKAKQLAKEYGPMLPEGFQLPTKAAKPTQPVAYSEKDEELDSYYEQYGMTAPPRQAAQPARLPPQQGRLPPFAIPPAVPIATPTQTPQQPAPNRTQPQPPPPEKKTKFKLPDFNPFG